MNEHFLSFIWKHQMFDSRELKTHNDLSLKISHPGYLNEHAGPDFSSGSIVLDHIDWRGNIELHVKSSDWYRHGHHNDEAYNNVILHVVYENDKEVYTKAGVTVPTLELSALISSITLQKYSTLIISKNKIPCGPQLPKVQPMTKLMVIEKSAYLRIQEKSKIIIDRLHLLKGDWIQVAYETLMRSWGFHINGEAFQQLAISLPAQIILKHADNVFQLEALFLGQANLLSSQDDYSHSLCQEYRFLKNKYSLTPLNPGVCRFLRTRPSNFPTVRLAQMAAIISSNSDLIGQLISAVSFNAFTNYFNVPPPKYWQSHTKCGVNSNAKVGSLSQSSLITLYVNSIAALNYAHATQLGNHSMKEFLNNLLDKLKPENNYITREWKKHGVTCSSVFQSQGLIHLHKNQCLFKKCHQCHIGIELLKG